jgi:hypothetical protein
VVGRLMSIESIILKEVALNEVSAEEIAQKYGHSLALVRSTLARLVFVEKRIHPERREGKRIVYKFGKASKTFFEAGS